MKDLTPYIGPITPELPAGIDLEYDAVFQQMQRLAEGVREQQYGDTIVAAKPPDWTALLPLTHQLCERTRDLRIGVLLVESLTHQHGLDGTVEGLRLLVNWVTELWDDVFPSLDDGEGVDPFMRVNSLGRLCQADRLPLLVRRALVFEQPPHLKIHCDDLLSALDSGETTGASSITSMEIEAAFLNAPPDQLQRLYDQSQSIVTSLQTIARTLETRTGESLWNAESLLNPLQSIRLHFKHHLQQRFQVRDAVLHEMQDLTDAEASFVAQSTSESSTSAGGVRSPIRIGSRDQAFAAIEAVTEYFARHEPSSPVPLLLRRARRIAEQDFIEILRELAPGALLECRQFTGAGVEDAA